VNPEVTILCLTYGRHKWLTEETFESFLHQDYPKKKMLVLNTHQDPIRIKGDPFEIEVLNIPDTFELFQDKVIHSLEQVRTPLWGVMDDDDIFLPWHISSLVGAWKKRTQSLKPSCVYHENMVYLEGNVIQSTTQWDLWGCYLFEKSEDMLTLFRDLVEGPSKSSELDLNIKNWEGWNKEKLLRYPQLPSYLYRWATDSRHLSGFGADPQAQLAGYDLCRSEANKIKNENPWKPQWRRDYVEDLYTFIRNNQPLTYNGRLLEVPDFLKGVIDGSGK